MAKVYDIVGSDNKTVRQHVIFCPGCKCGHGFVVDRWTFNGDYEKPTFNPSMLVNQDNPARRCHSFVRDGNIQFLNDCFHELAGQTVPLEDY